MNIYFIVATLIVLILAVVSLVISLQNNAKLLELLAESEGGDLRGDIKKYYKRVKDIEARMSLKTDDALYGRMTALEEKNRLNFSRTAVVSFDAFDDVKGTLSFALTLLNENNTGYIITSLYGNNSCNTYLREIEGGVCKTKLLAEEKQSLEKAMGGTLNEKK